jgi:predicted nucleic acid-binding protein
MKFLWGYSEFEELLKNNPSINTGILVDTNVLISATYDMDLFYEETTNFLDILVDKCIPLFCNVNVRSEFLEIHRRIIFTEALLSFESVTKGSALGIEFRKKLSSLRTNQKTREDQGRQSVRLSEADIKTFKSLMLQEDDGKLWTKFSTEYIGSSLIDVWSSTVENIGLNPLSLRKEDHEKYIITSPDWKDTVHLMSSHGISSSDAMIINMFRSSKFEVLASSDSDIGLTVNQLKLERKFCILPDEVKLLLT